MRLIIPTSTNKIPSIHFSRFNLGTGAHDLFSDLCALGTTFGGLNQSHGCVSVISQSQRMI